MIQAKVTSRPKPGMEAAAREAAANMVEHCRTDPGGVYYEYYVDPQNGDLICLEGFESSQAWLDHVPRNPFVADFVAAADVVSAEIYGEPSADLRGMLDQMGATYFGPLA